MSATLTRLVRQGELARDDGTWTLTGAPPHLETVGRRRDDPRRVAA